MYAWNGFSGNIYLIIQPELPFNDKICILLIERIHKAHLSYNHMRRILNKLLKLFNYTFTKLQHWYYTPCMHISILSIAIFHRLKCHTSPTPNPRVGGGDVWHFRLYISLLYYSTSEVKLSPCKRVHWHLSIFKKDGFWNFLGYKHLCTSSTCIQCRIITPHENALLLIAKGFIEACFKYRPEYLRLKQRNR